jgi:hypothetical protein
MQLLDRMSADDWTLTQYAYERRLKAGPSISQKHLRTLAWPTDVFLKKTAFLRFTGHMRTFKNASIEAEKNPGKTARANPKQDALDVKKAAWDFLRAYLEDPTWSESKKDGRKAEYFKQWGEKPWEAAKKK